MRLGALGRKFRWQAWKDWPGKKKKIYSGSWKKWGGRYRARAERHLAKKPVGRKR